MGKEDVLLPPSMRISISTRRPWRGTALILLSSYLLLVLGRVSSFLTPPPLQQHRRHPSGLSRSRKDCYRRGGARATFAAVTVGQGFSRPADQPDLEARGSARIEKARLRLAEAQGIIPAGASDRYESLGGIKRKTKVRDLTFKVAEPEVAYDPMEAETKLWRQPLRWLKRNVDIFVPLTAFIARVIIDIQTNQEKENRRQRARELLTIISGLGPAIIKAGQALSSRPDLLPTEYLEELQKLQDRLPAFGNEMAFDVVQRELGMQFDELFDLEEPDPIAAASIGQVYKARVRSTGELVAVKVQRPGCEEIISVDLYVLRWYAGLINRILRLLNRDIDVIAVIDDFGELIYREIDYTAEAANAQRFAELYGGIPEVFVPRVYPELSTRKVLTIEWVEGARLVDKDLLRQYQADSSKLVDTLVQCSLRQMLENGFFHADPHAGNLLCTPDGKLCYLDFGMMSYVESNQRYGIIEAVIHLVNRDFRALASLYQRMGFIPSDVDTKPIIVALEDALPEVLNASVGELNFKNVINKLGDVMYKFPFSLPPYYIAIIRCLGVLEGLAIQVDPYFRIISDAYPYIASRLLTDPAPELQSALRQLIFKNNKPRWERLEDLLTEATGSSDYDVTLAIDQLLDYILSDQGEEFRQIFAVELVNSIDRLGVDTTNYVVKNWRGLIASSATAVAASTTGQGAAAANTLAGLGLEGDVEEEAQDLTPAMRSARRLARMLAQSRGFEPERLLGLLRRLMREPKAQDLGIGIAADLSERIVARVVRGMFNIQDTADLDAGKVYSATSSSRATAA